MDLIIIIPLAIIVTGCLWFILRGLRRDKATATDDDTDVQTSGGGGQNPTLPK